VVQYGLPLAEAMPLFAALLSLPLGPDYVSLELSPEQQKEKTLHALLTILLKIAAQQPLLFVMEDLHWVDPSTLELRAAMSLSRLWHHQGKRDEAHELLAPIYGWFIEGFDTADLQEAKALLEALS
jgi:predicted ATPase